MTEFDTYYIISGAVVLLCLQLGGAQMTLNALLASILRASRPPAPRSGGMQSRWQINTLVRTRGSFLRRTAPSCLSSASPQICRTTSSVDPGKTCSFTTRTTWYWFLVAQRPRYLAAPPSRTNVKVMIGR